MSFLQSGLALFIIRQIATLIYLRRNADRMSEWKLINMDYFLRLPLV